MEAAFDALLSDPAKFERFAAQVDDMDVERPVPLRDQVEGYAVMLRQLVASGWTVEPYGFGRLDAFGSRMYHSGGWQPKVKFHIGPLSHRGQ